MARREESYRFEEHTRVRKAIGERTLTSVNEIPQFHLRTLVDMEPLVAFRQGLKASADPVPTYNDLSIKAAALTLREFPRFNGWCEEGGLKLLDAINIGFAVSTEQGVLLPTVRDADTKTLAQIAEETSELIELARAGRLRASLQMGAGFTISNLGPLGIDSFAPIISPPQVAILGIGSIKPQPMAVDGEVVVRRAAQMTLVMDHRAADGAEGGAFLAALAEAFTSPERLAED
ncbi:MAG: 2-oxo acid dehydrogenase subunit E2 [Armatimonadota bacterium]|nr:2-oxo acid dehydrogenase subunit E2 [Armatimonadota bacterium]